MSSRALVFVLGLALPAQAQSPLRTCGAAHEQSQELRFKGQLLAATESLRACTRSSCPLEIRRDCQAMQENVERALPSVVLSARAADAAALRTARVEVDGDPNALAVSGQTLELDPGKHHFRFVLFDGRERVVLIKLNEGDKAQSVVGDFGENVDSGSKPLQPLAYTLGGVGVAALGLFAFFAVRGNAQRSELRKCQPECTQPEVDTMKSRYLLADVFLGVSLVSLGAATYLFLQPAAAPSSSPRSGALGLPPLHDVTLSVGGEY
jgi:hypothetical protein